MFFFFFFFPAGFPPGFGVSEIGVYHENDPQKKFFLPEKAVVARFARASLAGTGREAKRAGGCYKKIFWEGLKGRRGGARYTHYRLRCHFHWAAEGRSLVAFGGRGWKLNKVRCLVRG